MRRFAQTLLFFSIALVGFRQAPAQGEIKFRDSQKTYEAIGRVINAETGAGIAFYEIRCGKLNKTRLNRTKQHWDTRRYDTGSGSDRVPSEAPCGGRRPVATAPGTVPMLLGPI
jgi:hypothetical protein